MSDMKRKSKSLMDIVSKLDIRVRVAIDDNDEMLLGKVLNYMEMLQG